MCTNLTDNKMSQKLIFSSKYSSCTILLSLLVFPPEKIDFGYSIALIHVHVLVAERGNSAYRKAVKVLSLCNPLWRSEVTTSCFQTSHRYSLCLLGACKIGCTQDKTDWLLTAQCITHIPDRNMNNWNTSDSSNITVAASVQLRLNVSITYSVLNIPPKQGTTCLFVSVCL